MPEVLDGTIITKPMDQGLRAKASRIIGASEQRGLYFDQEEGERFVAFFERFLHHSKGQWAGQHSPCSLAAVHDLQPVWMEAG